MGTPARPKWRIGQILQPRDLRALEDALSAESAQRVASAGLPAYGVLKLDWHWTETGLVFKDGLVAILPNGTVIDVPGNADVRAPLDLASVGGTPLDVYVHLLDPAPPEDDDAEALDPTLPAREVVRSRHLLALSTSLDLPTSHDRMLLGRFALDRDGRYQPVESVLPPLLRVDATPAIDLRMKRIDGDLDEIDRKLDALAADAVRRGVPLAPIHRVRIESHKLRSLLADLAQRVRLQPHPYWVFSAVRAFAIELSVLDETAPLALPVPYDHDRPWRSFSTVLDVISKWASWSPPGSPRVEFLPDGSGRMVATLPDDALGASETYVVVLKPDDTSHIPFEQIRLASPSRLRLVREFVLRGVPFAHDARPPFRFGFGAGAEFFARRGGGEEWEHVLRDKAIAFRSTPDLERLRFLLCWRQK